MVTFPDAFRDQAVMLKMTQYHSTINELLQSAGRERQELI